MCRGSYVPRDLTAYDDIIYNLLPNTFIDYISSEHGRDVVYHLELNSNKVDKYNRPVKKYQIRILNRSDVDQIRHPHFSSNQIVPPRVPNRGMYDRINSVSRSPDDINEEDDDLSRKEKYRKKTRKLQMFIRPIGYIKHNNNSNFNDFIRDFNMIHTPNYDNNSLLHPPDYNPNLSFYDGNGDLNPDIRNIQEYYQNHRDSNLFYNPFSSDNNFIQPTISTLTPLEEFRQALRIQRKKKKKKKKR
jgi:hypothetical protein